MSNELQHWHGPKYIRMGQVCIARGWHMVRQRQADDRLVCDGCRSGCLLPVDALHGKGDRIYVS